MTYGSHPDTCLIGELFQRIKEKKIYNAEPGSFDKKIYRTGKSRKTSVRSHPLRTVLRSYGQPSGKKDHAKAAVNKNFATALKIGLFNSMRYLYALVEVILNLKFRYRAHGSYKKIGGQETPVSRSNLWIY
jgi:hypothetical protein